MCIYAMPHGGVDALLFVLEVLRTAVWIVGSCYLRFVFHFFFHISYCFELLWDLESDSFVGF
jgi:hypothetical protein